MSTALDDVAVAVSDGATVLDEIETVAQLFFAAKPNPEAQARVEQAIQKARTALTVAARTAQGAKQLDQAHVDSAFQSFREAYSDLATELGKDGVAAVGPDGVVTPTPTKFAAAKNGEARETIHAPIALSLRIHP